MAGNLLILKGNLGADPEMFYTTDGDPIASFNLAFKTGKDKTGWVRIKAFSKQAEIAEKYLHKGARIIVFGRLDPQEWETDDGEKRKSFQIIAHSFEFIKTDGRGFEDSE
jgi:single-strand DNA-binding protein